MSQSIIEDNQVHDLTWVGFIVKDEFLLNNRSDGIQASNSFIDEWCCFYEISILVDLIFSLEVGEQDVVLELIVFHVESILESLDCDFVEICSQRVFVWLVDKLIFKHSQTFVSPQ